MVLKYNLRIMKRITLYIRLVCLLWMVAVTAFAAPEASFKKLYKTYTLNKDGSMVEREYIRSLIFILMLP